MNNRADESEGVWLPALALSELPPGMVAEVVVGGTVLALMNLEGEIRAVDGICAHQGGPLGKGQLTGCTLTCPWHGWQYDAATGCQLLSEVIAQRVYATRVREATIEVMLAPPG